MRANVVTITRGRSTASITSRSRDDGDGVPRDADGVPDFRYVATHICDSIKRRLKADGVGTALQGEFGIGLLSFWTVGEKLTVTSTGCGPAHLPDEDAQGRSGIRVGPRRVLFAERGTELSIARSSKASAR